MSMDSGVALFLSIAVISISTAAVKIAKARVKAKVLIAYYDAIAKSDDPARIKPPYDA